MKTMADHVVINMPKMRTKQSASLKKKNKSYCLGIPLSIFAWVERCCRKIKHWIGHRLWHKKVQDKAISAEEARKKMISANSQAAEQQSILEFKAQWDNQMVLAPDNIAPNEFFRLNKTLGDGSYGKVELVYRECAPFAMKTISIGNSLKRGYHTLDHICREVRVLRVVQHPFIVQMHHSFWSSSNVYLIFECVRGGDFFDVITSIRKFDEAQVLFYAAQMVSIVEYLQKRNLVHRDLKAENFLFCDDGYLKLTDFGASKMVEEDTGTICGTNACMAPEMVSRFYDRSKRYTKAVDLWSLGVNIYEIAYDKSPFFDDDKETLYKNVLKKQIKGLFNSKRKIPISANFKNFLTKLLERDPTKRLGSDDPTKIRQHSWFNSLNWERLENKKYPAPFLPVFNDKGDFEYYYDIQKQERIYRSTNCSEVLDKEF